MRDVSSSTPAPAEGREAAILTAVLEEYFETGAPVGSKVLAEREPSAPSSATIRHVLADLEHSGFLLQPHTSAGRVPTAQAIRWWLQHLDGPAMLGPDDAHRLEELLREAPDETRLWLQASEFLAEVTQQVGIVVVQPWLDAGLKQLRFVRLNDARILTVVATCDGHLRERVSRVPEAYTQPELDTAARYFNLHFAGSTMRQIRRELMRRIEEERAAYDELLKRVLVLSQCGVLRTEDEGAMYFYGAGRLAEVLDRHKLGEVLARLNEKERWLHLLTASEDGGEELVQFEAGDWGFGKPCSVQVRVGLDRQMPEFSLVSTRYGQGGIGILGPRRMEYRRALSAVALVGELFGRVLGEQTA